MKDSIRARLESVTERHEEIAALLGEPDVLADQDRFRELSREYARLEPVVAAFGDYRRCLDDLDVYLRDDAFAWDMDASGEYVRRAPEGEAPFSAQQALIERLDESYPHD